ncbi:hypothetical protein [Breznakiella homolactica]|uniref:Uncharacterized protein n=1 Tax=Breznakiella homolactica TaxID=2798577 RepID=A0A7T7XM11_9SPIR|nr:hypothetical protein [Breznakiella homolactica]QQO08800.1 hypothetical protein JFL75_18005 [Breznakiella homolactica]
MKDILDFLVTRVNGKTLYTKELVYELEGGALQGVYSDQISFSNLLYSKSGLRLDMFIVSNEKIYTIGEGKQRESLRKDFSGAALFRYELALRKSTGELTGLFRFISASGTEVPSEAVVSGIRDVRLEEGALRLTEDQALYRDQPAGDGSWKAVAFRSNHRFFLKEGKLHYEYDGVSFDVDPLTLERRVSADRFPPFVSAER